MSFLVKRPRHAVFLQTQRRVLSAFRFFSLSLCEVQSSRGKECGGMGRGGEVLEEDDEMAGVVGRNRGTAQRRRLAHVCNVCLVWGFFRGSDS